MSENSNEKINFVLNVLREFSIEEERNLFNCKNDKERKQSQLNMNLSESLEDLRDPFCDESEETKIKLVLPKQSVNAKFKDLIRNQQKTIIVKTPTFPGETADCSYSKEYSVDMEQAMKSCGVEVFKVDKQRAADELEETSKLVRGKKKEPQKKPDTIDYVEVESLSGFRKLAEAQECSKGFPITEHTFNILKDNRLEWLRRKSVGTWDEREESKRKCVKWLMDKT